MNDLLLQLLTGAVDITAVEVVYDSVCRAREEDCVIVLYSKIPVMFTHGDAQAFRKRFKKRTTVVPGKPALKGTAA